jgi:hypothetical protein
VRLEQQRLAAAVSACYGRGSREARRRRRRRRRRRGVLLLLLLLGAAGRCLNLILNRMRALAASPLSPCSSERVDRSNGQRWGLFVSRWVKAVKALVNRPNQSSAPCIIRRPPATSSALLLLVFLAREAGSSKQAHNALAGWLAGWFVFG